jgi:hypothetical protein
MSELDIPPEAQKDPKAFEILRVWACQWRTACDNTLGTQGKAYDFGYMLADLAFHAANLYSERFNVSVKEALNDIIDGFKDEINNQENDISGEIMK